MSTRYEISERELDVLAITGPEGTRYIDGEEIEARVIRQQSADIAALQQVISDQILVIEDLDYRRGKVCDENDQLSAELAAVVGELDKYRLKLREVAQTIIDQIGSVGPENAINAALRACEVIESIATRLAAIDAAPVAAVVREMKRDFASGPYKFLYYDSDKLPAGCTELIAKPAKD